ncbi:hypothetical protein VDGL01_10204 [Verticillium dahliae]
MAHMEASTGLVSLIRLVAIRRLRRSLGLNLLEQCFLQHGLLVEQGIRRRQRLYQILGDILNSVDPRNVRQNVQIRKQTHKHITNVRLNHESEPLDLEPPDECELGTQRWRLDDIRRTPDAAVKRHDEPPTLSNHLLQARDSAIDLPPFVVADDDAVETEIRCPLGVVNPLDSFDEEGPCRR